MFNLDNFCVLDFEQSAIHLSADTVEGEMVLSSYLGSVWCSFSNKVYSSRAFIKIVLVVWMSMKALY